MIKTPKEPKDPKTISITIKCLHCGEKFPSPMFMTTRGVFSTATLTGNKAQCHYCNKMTNCNKENFVARFEDGGFIGNDAL
ncbi:hypothetical protein FZZ93_01020 [Halomonas eurihalina]|uniref:Uncharacterized protein n=1 Tax=Halomonas eurihalina TaxID=42566 RepID=A0A5D9DBU6_HALER|nr:hypothetical protein FZZ93_01020 [Halomonas eurihalina]